MLVLTRKSQEQIRIGNDIVVTVLRVKGNSVRVGIEAPRDVRVVRGELPPKELVAEIQLHDGDAFDGPEGEVGETTVASEASLGELSEPSFCPPKRTLKDYVASAISHAV